MKNCPVCERDTLIDKQCEEKITYLGVSGKVNFYYSECLSCNSELVNYWQCIVNKDNVLYFHRLVDMKGVDWLHEGVKNPSNPC